MPVIPLNPTTLAKNIPADAPPAPEINLELASTDDTNVTDDGSGTEDLSITNEAVSLFPSTEQEIGLIPTSVTLTTSPSTEMPSTRYDIASTDINHSTESNPANSTDLESGSGMSITDVPTLANATAITENLRAGRNIDTFPGELAILLHNNPVENIAKFKLDINRFADELVNHQQHYGLSECLFEPLEKIGEAFRESYAQKGLNQIPVDRYIKYISDLKNASCITLLNCSDINNWSLSTTTETPLSSTELTTIDEFVNETVNLSNASTTATTEIYSSTLASTPSTQYVAETVSTSNSSTATTPELSESSAASTTPVTSFNVTLDSTDTIDIDSTLHNGQKPVSTEILNSKLINLGLISGAQGFFGGIVFGMGEFTLKHLDKKGHLKGWREPVVRAGVTLFNATTLATLPILLSTVEDESEQSNSLTKVLQSTAYSLGSSLLLNSVNYAARRAYAYFNTAPMNKDSIASKALEALPLLANTSLLINSGYNLTDAAVIVGSNTVAAGLSNAVTQSGMNYFFNSKKNKDADVEKVLGHNHIEMDDIEKNPFDQDDFNLDSRFQTLASKTFNTKNSTSLDEFLIVLDKMKFFENKGDIKTQAFFLKNLILLAAQNPDISLHVYNHLQSQERLLPINKNLEANCSIIPFTLNETVNLETHNDKESNADKNTIQLKKLLGSFISGLKLNTKGFKFESKIFKAENKYSFERINIFYGTNQALSIFMPEIEQASANHELLFSAINQLLENLSKNKSTANNSKFLFVLPIQSTSAAVEIVTYPSSSIRKISVYNPDNLLKNKLKTLTNKAKKYGYVTNNNPEINSSQANFQQHNPFSVYYFIKNAIKNYLETCLLPNNASPDFLEGLLATFIYKLKLTGLEFETEKVNPTENNKVSALAKKHIAPKNVNHTEEEIDLKNGYLVSTIDRKRNNAIAVGLSTKTLSIFKAIRPDNRANRTEIINCLLSKRTLEIQNDEIRRDLLPLADEKGMAIIEIITSESESKIIIHDLLGLLADIHTTIVAIAEKNGYQYAYNPNKDYSSDWQSKERCQLAAYNFIKTAALRHLKLSDRMNTKFINNDVNLPNDILDEVKHNLSINNEYDMDSLHEIKRCDGGVFNLKAYITDVSNYLKILSVKTKTVPLTNNSNLSQTITNEIQYNLGLTASLSKLSGSLHEVIIWNGVRFENWSELFSTKEVTLSETKIGNVYYLIKFPSDFMIVKGKMAVLCKQENSEPEHALLSDLRSLLVYNSSDKRDIKIVKKELWMNALRELFSKFVTKTETNQETKLHSADLRANFFSKPNSTAAAPVQENHLRQGYK